LTVVEGDIRDQAGVEKVLSDFGCTAVIHFAGLKSVLDSVTSPLDYYDNNVVGTHRLLRAMQASRVRRIIFSSDRGNESDVLSAPPRAPETGAGRWRPLWGHLVAD
jgi:UDP-glucose 4-epimerase